MQKFVDNIKSYFATPLDTCLIIADMVILAFFVYFLCAFLRKNNATRLIKVFAIAAVFGVCFYSLRDKMPATGYICSFTVITVIFAYFTMFPHEFKRGLWKIASPRESAGVYTAKYDCSYEDLQTAITEIVKAVQNMSKRNVGALIVIAPDDIPMHIIESGTKLDAYVSCQLLESIFNTKAPLHDGAVYVRGDKILAAGCFLPLTQKLDVDKDIGTRHRAAIGVTEEYDHLAIIVSEETGIISVARGGEIERYYDSEMLTDVLEQACGLRATLSVGGKKRRK